MEPPPPPPHRTSVSSSADSGSHDLATPDLITDLHEHPLIPFTRFAFGYCNGCDFWPDDYARSFGVGSSASCYIYGGYRCNDLECNGEVVFHKECGKPLQEIHHYSHPHHSLKLIIQYKQESHCSLCGSEFKVGYCCSVCDFKLDFVCARRPEPLFLPENSYGHEHPLQLVHHQPPPGNDWDTCKACPLKINPFTSFYRCHRCEFVIHVDCIDLTPKAYHNSHPQHPLKSLKSEVPDYSDERCLLCGTEFDERHHQLHHCDVCNFSICRACFKNPPPVVAECPTTHEHQLRLFPRRIAFTCNACGTQGDRSPYFCLQCNFMIHRQCIGLPRVININRHDHRIAYTSFLGHGEWKCRVCREKVDGFYGAYTCDKCPKLVVHSLCATRNDVWDMVEREGTPEEEIAPPFEVIDDYTIKHFSHDHHLKINKDSHGDILSESKLCVACVFQICSKPFYSCEKCDFILHEKCAHLPRKKRHVCHNQPFTLQTSARDNIDRCHICFQDFTGFRYKSSHVTIDVRCSMTSDSLEHKSHQHPLYYDALDQLKQCSHCEKSMFCGFSCSQCDYYLDGKCALLPKKVMKKRYDDHSLFLCLDDKNDGGYWCEACETKLDRMKWFYTCNDCGIALHISCVVGDFSYIMPGSVASSGEMMNTWGESFRKWSEDFITWLRAEVVSNNSICRPHCYVCNSRCKLPSILKLSLPGDEAYICSYKCRKIIGRIV